MESDEVVLAICRFAKDILKAKRVMIFGSRARGDHLTRSDYDIAVLPDPSCVQEWGRFTAAVDEQVPTLLHIDLVNLAEQLDPDFAQRISKEGRIVYERES